MQATISTTVERQVRIDAPAETVYAYFIDPERMSQWMAIRAEVDPRPGGRVRWDMNGFDIARGEFIELVPHSRIVFTWGWESLGDGPRPGSSRIEVTLEPDGDATILRLVHSGLDEIAAPMHDEGWAHYLEILAAAARTGAAPNPPQPLTESEAIASQINTLYCELRELLEASDDDTLGRLCPGTAWPAAVTATHMISHAVLGRAAVDFANGIRPQVADITPEQLEAMNAGLNAAPRASRDALIATLRAEVPPVIDAIKGLDDAGLAKGQPMAVAGGATLSARDLLHGPLLTDIRDHLADIRAALA